MIPKGYSRQKDRVEAEKSGEISRKLGSFMMYEVVIRNT